MAKQRSRDRRRSRVATDGQAPGAERDNGDAEVLRRQLAGHVADVVRAGWTPHDLGQIVRRRLDGRHVPALVAALSAEADRHPPVTVADEWRRELRALGRGWAIDGSAAGLRAGFDLCALLAVLPPVTVVLPAPGQATRVTGPVAAPSSRQLARVRSLLAKAESTAYDEEAEALSAKAQELISKYALDQILDGDEGQQSERTDGSVVPRRLWIDAPYVLAKAHLVNAVARANRCRCVVVEDLGFSTLIGMPADVDWVELLSTSLLVQADRAVLRCGRQFDLRGTSRTRSFRRAFLIAYAQRIGERLRMVSDRATDAAERRAGPGNALVPLLAERSRQVDAAYMEWFPRTVARDTTISNRDGWASGRAAADQAVLDPRMQPGRGPASLSLSGDGRG